MRSTLVLEMLIVHDQCTPNLPFLLALLDVTGYVIYYYIDQCITLS